ncbi:hypothetical protein Bbelb_296690 [Branchiostoma belcheri]|nr:hypothetical protein Bbelb_296690 [Branchiostoma belcheri]
MSRRQVTALVYARPDVIQASSITSQLHQSSTAPRDISSTPTPSLRQSAKVKASAAFPVTSDFCDGFLTFADWLRSKLLGVTAAGVLLKPGRSSLRQSAKVKSYPAFPFTSDFCNGFLTFADWLHSKLLGVTATEDSLHSKLLGVTATEGLLKPRRSGRVCLVGFFPDRRKPALTNGYVTAATEKRAGTSSESAIGQLVQCNTRAALHAGT